MLLKAKYEVIGVHHYHTKIWYWSWALPYQNKQITKMSNNVVDFGKKHKNSYKKYDSKEIDSLYYLSTQGYFCARPDIIQLLVGLYMRVNKSLWYFPIRHGIDLISKQQSNNSEYRIVEYIAITEIILEK